MTANQPTSPASSSLLTQIPQDIHTAMQKLSSGELTSVALTRMLLARIEQLQTTVKPLALVFKESALEAAAASDVRRKQNTLLSPLDGIPITIKENIDIARYPSTIGMNSRRDHRAEKDAFIVEQLRKAGCIFLGKSNLSQAMLFHESRNPVYGQTQNPHNSTRAPGGSSGGEAAAIAAGASMGGFGTDIGGSIRIPAHFCGVVGIKPTVDRISNNGINGAIGGQEMVRGQVGPMARTVADVALLLEAISPELGSHVDARVPPLPWSLPLIKDSVKGWRVGLVYQDGLVTPSRAVQRALQEAAEALRQAGAEVIELQLPHVEELIFSYFAGMSADGGKTLLSQIDADDLDEALKPIAMLARTPAAARKIASKGAQAAGEMMLSRMLGAVGEKNVATFWGLVRTMRRLQLAEVTWWNEHHLDGLLCPVHATPAIHHGMGKDFTLAGSFSMRYNFVNFPAGSVPVTTVRADEEIRLLERNQSTNQFEKRAARVDAGSKGLPVGVQVVGRPYREDTVLTLMSVIEKAARLVDGYPNLLL